MKRQITVEYIGEKIAGIETKAGGEGTALKGLAVIKRKHLLDRDGKEGHSRYKGTEFYKVLAYPGNGQRLILVGGMG